MIDKLFLSEFQRILVSFITLFVQADLLKIFFLRWYYITSSDSFYPHSFLIFLLILVLAAVYLTRWTYNVAFADAIL